MIKKTPIIDINVSNFIDSRKNATFRQYIDRDTTSGHGCKHMSKPNPNKGIVLVRVNWKDSEIKFIKKIKLYQYNDAFFIAVKRKARNPYRNEFVFETFKEALNYLYDLMIERKKHHSNIESFEIRFTEQGKKKAESEGFII